MQLRGIDRLFSESPWAIRPEVLIGLVGLGRKASISESMTALRETQAAAPQTTGGVAVLPLSGPLLPEESMLSFLLGATPLSGFRAVFREAMADSKIGAIVLDIDSPGGLVDQIPELAAEIREARKSKPIVAVANTQAASAAYWLGTQASQLFVSPSAQVGSVGVYATHVDFSEADKQAGVKTTLISAGKYKVEGNEYEPLGTEAEKYIQSIVDSYYGMFVADIAAGRGTSESAVRGGFGEGRMVLATEAVNQGMADQVGSIDAAITHATGLGGGNVSATARSFSVSGLKIVGNGSVTATNGSHTTVDLHATAIPSHSTGTSDAPFDAGAMKARLPNEEAPLRQAHAWVDPEGDAKTKGSYKFIHHMVSEAGSVGAANTRACSNGIGVLNGGRGGADIPDDDRKGVYNHLARHLKDAGRDDIPPLQGQVAEEPEGQDDEELEAAANRLRELMFAYPQN